MTPAPNGAVLSPNAVVEGGTAGIVPFHWHPFGRLVCRLGPKQGFKLMLLFGASKLGWLKMLKNCAS